MDHPLISSYGTLPGIAGAKLRALDTTKPYNILCSSLVLRLEPEECNHHTSNTRELTGQDSKIDFSLYEYSPLPETGYIRLLEFAAITENNEKYFYGRLKKHRKSATTRFPTPGVMHTALAISCAWTSRRLICQRFQSQRTWQTGFDTAKREFMLSGSMPSA